MVPEQSSSEGSRRAPTEHSRRAFLKRASGALTGAGVVVAGGSRPTAASGSAPPDDSPPILCANDWLEVTDDAGVPLARIQHHAELFWSFNEATGVHQFACKQHFYFDPLQDHAKLVDAEFSQDWGPSVDYDTLAVQNVEYSPKTCEYSKEISVGTGTRGSLGLSAEAEYTTEVNTCFYERYRWGLESASLLWWLERDRPLQFDGASVVMSDEKEHTKDWDSLREGDLVRSLVSPELQVQVMRDGITNNDYYRGTHEMELQVEWGGDGPLAQVESRTGTRRGLGCAADADGGTEGAATNTWTEEGTVSEDDERDVYTYRVDTPDPQEATIDLRCGDGGDADLYVTLDGRQPTPSDFDRSSTDRDAERVVVGQESLDPGSALGLLVDRYSGECDYRLTVEESGRE